MSYLTKHSKTGPNIKKVWLFRHGESVANARGISSDPALVPLTETGLAQADLIVKEFNIVPDLIITSPYVRTAETARPLLKRYPDIPREEWPVHEFTYISPYRCQNTNMADRKPMVEQYWRRADPNHCDGEGAESFNNFLDRARSSLSLLKGRKEKFIVIFTHGQFICAIKWLLDQNINPGKISDMLVFREFISTIAPKNGQKMEVVL